LFTNSNITITDNISNNSNGLASFKNLTLWKGANQISGAVQMSIGSNGVGTIVFPLSNPSTITIQNNSPLSFQMHGDVNLAGSAIINSIHNFSITGSSITGTWQYHDSPTNITASGDINGSSIVILPYYATLDAGGSGNGSNTNSLGMRNRQTLNENIASITLAADPIETGSATVSSITLRLTGNGLFNQNNPAHYSSIPINLLGAGGNLLDTEQCVEIPSVTGQTGGGLSTGTGTCSITFPLNIVVGSAAYTLQSPNPVIQNQNTPNQNVQLFLDDATWTDGTTPNIHWNASNQPTQIFNYTYQGDY
jgi:hypothetical protein